MRFFYIYLVFLPSLTSWGQIDSLETISLKEVVIRAVPYAEYGVGLRVQQLDSNFVRGNPTSSLGDLLQQHTDAYIKAYGSGMLQSISLRGTAAGHTAVLWNGVNIASPTLGETDFSTIPLLAADRLVLLQGGSSALVGSDAIGGALVIESGVDNSALAPGLLTAYRSTHQWIFNIHSGWRFSERLKAFTQLYGTQSANLFTNRLVEPNIRVDYAPFRWGGFRQELFYKLSQKAQFDIYTWYHEQDIRLISNRARQWSRSLRMIGRYHDLHQLLQLSVVRDFMEYNHMSRIATTQWQAQYHYEHQWAERLQSRVGWTATLIQSDVDQYEGKPTRQQLEAFFFTQWSPADWLQAALNLRRVWVNGYQPPFAPSLGIEARLLERDRWQWALGGSTSYNYKLPSLNALFWQPGGKPDLRPESGLYFVAFSELKAELGLLHWQWHLEGFRNHIRDWILWQPTDAGYWSPDNLQEVMVRGLQTSLKQEWLFSNMRLTATLQYTFTQALSQNTTSTSPSYHTDKQLPYTPRHRWAFQSGLDYGRWASFLFYQWSGIRYTSLDNQAWLQPFYTLDWHLSYRAKVAKLKVDCSLAVLNLTDVVYAQVQNQPMPGRQYQLSLRVNLESASQNQK